MRFKLDITMEGKVNKEQVRAILFRLINSAGMADNKTDSGEVTDYNGDVVGQWSIKK